ncbi:MAG: hypothetical protein NC412_01445 [Roseburia sp.]|nr:hypothetical protein [Roseburia sp.]MCM1277730.1 hypothetical protein [Robinsoniella sp.]
MYRLMKAEWYRLRHSSKLIKWLFVLCMVCVSLPLFVDIEVIRRNLAENLLAAQSSLTFFMAGFLPLFSAVIIGIAYMNRTAYYEVMAGNKIYQIVLSKVFVDAGVVNVSVFLCLGIYWTVIGLCNGIGEIGQLPLRFVLLFFVLFHICTSGVLIITSVRQILGAILAYMRFVLAETVIMFVLQVFEENFSETMIAKIADWFILLKLTKILNFEYEITNHLIFTVAVGFLIEIAFWFGISYIGMKKQFYK